MSTRPKRPLYVRMLRLRHLRLSPALMIFLFEGSVVLGILLALADIVNWWGVIAVPAAVGLAVKLNDVVAGLLKRPLAEAQLRAPRMVNDVAVGRSPVRPPIVTERDVARGVAAVPVSDQSSDRPNQGHY